MSKNIDDENFVSIYTTCILELLGFIITFQGSIKLVQTLN